MSSMIPLIVNITSIHFKALIFNHGEVLTHIINLPKCPHLLSNGYLFSQAVVNLCAFCLFKSACVLFYDILLETFCINDIYSA